MLSIGGHAKIDLKWIDWLGRFGHTYPKLN